VRQSSQMVRENDSDHMGLTLQYACGG
jgi:hypothetical protein